MSENALQPLTGRTLGYELPGPTEWQMLEQQARALVSSGYLPAHIKNPQQAIAIMLKGRELDVPPWTALTKIHVIGGIPTVAPELMLALIRRSGQLEDFAITKNDETLCTIEAKRVGESRHSETFTWQEASKLTTQDKQKGTIPLTDKYNWRQQPAVMLRWRCISRWARTYFGDVVSGLYTPEEINPDVTFNEDGDVIDIPAEVMPDNPVLGIDPTDFGKRPWDADTFGAAFLEYVATSDNTHANPSKKQGTYIASLMSSAFPGDNGRKDRLAVLEWLTGRTIATSNDLTGAEASAMIDLLADEQGELGPNQYTELQNCLREALLAQGQIDMFDTGEAGSVEE